MAEFVNGDPTATPWKSRSLRAGVRDYYHVCGFRNMTVIPWTDGWPTLKAWSRSGGNATMPLVSCWAPTASLRDRDFSGYTCANDGCYRLVHPDRDAEEQEMNYTGGVLAIVFGCLVFCFDCYKLCVDEDSKLDLEFSGI